jgi:hypothetical protein
MNSTPLAHRLRETALWVPRAQQRTLLELAAEADRLETALDQIVADAVADATALATARVQGYG